MESSVLSLIICRSTLCYYVITDDEKSINTPYNPCPRKKARSQQSFGMTKRSTEGMKGEKRRNLLLLLLSIDVIKLLQVGAFKPESY